MQPSRLPLLKKHVAAMVCNMQKGPALAPVGLLGAWPREAERGFLDILQRPKVLSSTLPVKQFIFDVSSLVFP